MRQEMVKLQCSASELIRKAHASMMHSSAHSLPTILPPRFPSSRHPLFLPTPSPPLSHLRHAQLRVFQRSKDDDAHEHGRVEGADEGDGARGGVRLAVEEHREDSAGEEGPPASDVSWRDG